MINAFITPTREEVYLKIEDLTVIEFFYPNKHISFSHLQFNWWEAKTRGETNIAAHCSRPSLTFPTAPTRTPSRSCGPTATRTTRESAGTVSMVGLKKFFLISWWDNSPLESFSHKEKVKVRPYSSFCGLVILGTFLCRTLSGLFQYILHYFNCLNVKRWLHLR